VSNYNHIPDDIMPCLASSFATTEGFTSAHQDWITAAAARYVHHGLSEDDAQVAARALWDDYNSRIIPEVCVDNDIGDLTR
jgi:hypothetical protein